MSSVDLRYAVKAALHNDHGALTSRLCQSKADARTAVSDEKKEEITETLEKHGFTVDDNYDVHDSSEGSSKKDETHKKQTSELANTSNSSDTSKTSEGEDDHRGAWQDSLDLVFLLTFDISVIGGMKVPRSFCARD